MITTATGMEARHKALTIEHPNDLKYRWYVANVWGARDIVAFDADGQTVAAAGITRDCAGRWEVWFSAQPVAARFSMALAIIGKRWLDRTLTASRYGEAPVVAKVLPDHVVGQRLALALGFVEIGRETGLRVYRRPTHD